MCVCSSKPFTHSGTHTLLGVAESTAERWDYGAPVCEHTLQQQRLNTHTPPHAVELGEKTISDEHSENTANTENKTKNTA